MDKIEKEMGMEENSVEVTVMKYCPYCGGTLNRRIPPGDDRERHVCDHCRRVYYENPKMVVGCIPEWEERILMCRRAIAPARGKWTLPAGYLENGESVAQGAVRETLEEAGAAVRIIQPYALFSLPSVNHIYVMFHARMASSYFCPGEESLSVALFEEEQIPWKDIAFTVIEETLRRFFLDRGKNPLPFHSGVISRR